MNTLRATPAPSASPTKGLRNPRGGLGAVLFLSPLLLVIGGCESTGPPDYESLPPQTLSPFPAPGTETSLDPLGDSIGLPSTDEVVSNLDLAPDAAEESEPEPTFSERAASDGNLILIGDDEPDSEEGDIWERVRVASQKERSRREDAEEPVVMITNKNLSEMAEGGRITFVKPAPGGEAAASATDIDGSGTLAEMREQEIYWRERARDIRVRLKDSWDDVEELEDQAAELRMRFYREDDPFTRDGKIKPAWDHTLERLDTAQVQVDETQLELENFMEEGRRAGALPGWLREGSELIPPRPEQEQIPEAEVGEPTVVESPP